MWKRIGRYSVRFLVAGFITFVLMKLTTFGWLPALPSAPLFDIEGRAEILKSHVEHLATTIGERDLFHYEKLMQAQNYIIAEFQRYGYQVALQEYQVWGKPVRNIIARKSGGAKSDEIILVGAHYDSCANPGANDNASGVAGMLELARAFSNVPMERTIDFVAFVNEEPPFFRTSQMGSVVYARAARQGGESIMAVLNLEMIGYYSEKPFSQRYPYFSGPFFPHKGNFIAVLGNSTGKDLVRRIEDTFKAQSRFPIGSLASSWAQTASLSDHWSFWQQGYVAVMITDTAFHRYPYYHTPQDTPDKLDYQRMALVVRGLIPVVRMLADMS